MRLCSRFFLLSTYFQCTEKRATVGAGKEGLFMENSELGNIENLDRTGFKP